MAELSAGDGEELRVTDEEDEAGLEDGVDTGQMETGHMDQTEMEVRVRMFPGRGGMGWSCHVVGPPLGGIAAWCHRGDVEVRM